MTFSINVQGGKSVQTAPNPIHLRISLSNIKTTPGKQIPEARKKTDLLTNDDRQPQKRIFILQKNTPISQNPFKNGEMQFMQVRHRKLVKVRRVNPTFATPFTPGQESQSSPQLLFRDFPFFLVQHLFQPKADSRRNGSNRQSQSEIPNRKFVDRDVLGMRDVIRT
jgi:hypothetical protein